MSYRVGILGSGAWGTAIALVLSQKPEHDVRLWAAREATAATWFASRENNRLLPGVAIPDQVRLTVDVAEALEAVDLIVSAVPTVHLRAVLDRIRGITANETPVLSLTKGIENATFQRPTEIILDVLGARPVAVLSGPSHAEEVARGLPTTLVAASQDEELAKTVQTRFGTDRFRVYTNADVVGVELAGAIKNVIGIAAGISDGLGFGDNAKSALLTRGLTEMARFGMAMEADQATFWGLAGMGDLITTCISKHGRNRAVGLRLAAGESLADILNSSAMVAEGVFTTRSVYERSCQLGISMPISTEVFRVLYQSKAARDAVTDLMMREPTKE